VSVIGRETRVVQRVGIGFETLLANQTREGALLQGPPCACPKEQRTFLGPGELLVQKGQEKRLECGIVAMG
jgi:hypothetical protein